ncbi:SOS-response transcriptional repressor, LexA [Acidimicrobium ferrooxidans DSM 10331]|uniref:SOS-response transcriptional repressor, LexA n=1 Tax=Acidimicrobium ferrooxidans (strain DSM 10331 / JCM 15462 / NBRC 103882 / ICP) TaxID=525909 RepID=C7LY14_ACIFD|nr:transcriptional repressor LexA [Acidimicrobium ferrooxidans]ACU53622.1 SOS-response transcriptional repressor, LexA [Acidimicrobium ferrooxidans DSM 10331]
MTRENPEVREAILAYVTQVVEERGWAPSVREIADAVGLKSPASVQHHLRRLERDGRLVRSPLKARSLSVARRAPSAAVPVLAEVGAGYHVVPEVEVETSVAVPASMAAPGAFALRVRGHSMVDVGILDGDLVVVAPSDVAADGDIVVASVGDDVGTVKILRRNGSSVWLEGANEDDPSLAPMPWNETCHLHGRVVGVLRSYDGAAVR